MNKVVLRITLEKLLTEFDHHKEQFVCWHLAHVHNLDLSDVDVLMAFHRAYPEMFFAPSQRHEVLTDLIVEKHLEPFEELYLYDVSPANRSPQARRVTLFEYCLEEFGDREIKFIVTVPETE